MKIAVLFAVTAAISGLSPSLQKEARKLGRDTLKHWLSFKRRFGKSYVTAGVEVQRLKTFDENRRRIDKHNRLFREGRYSYSLGVNGFTDMTVEEFGKTMGGRGAFTHNETSGGGLQRPSLNSGYRGGCTDNLNWRDLGRVSHTIHRQGKCEACAVFTVAGLLEGVNVAQTHVLKDVSVQWLLDCASAHGCAGDWPQHIARYAVSCNVGFADEYPMGYRRKKEKCKATCARGKDGVGLASYGHMVYGEVTELTLRRSICIYGPVVAALAFNGEEYWRFGQLHRGIYDWSPGVCKKKNEPDYYFHSVLAYGYGHRDRTHKMDYWIIKNSWGWRWGVGGRALISRARWSRCIYSVVFGSGRGH